MRINRSEASRGVADPARGFTLLELVITVAIMSILIGAAVPVASMFFRSKATRATRAELEELAAASAEYFLDTFQLPGEPEDLHVDPGVSGWQGPYMLTATDDPILGITDSLTDAWARSFLFDAPSTSVLRIVSAGEDGTFDTEADIEVSLDVTPIRRAQTLLELKTINQAITLYNGVNLPDNPLSTSYSKILSDLALAGLLPSGAGFETDGWGDAYVSDPAGKTPVVRVGSIHLTGGEAGGGS
jgi:prepilin-type N-terminal cleavage/methylation domain-containing protein